MKSFHILILVLCLFTRSLCKQVFFDKNLWIFWNNDIQKAPLFVQLCYQKMKMVCQQQNWNLVLLTNDNLPSYLSNYEQFLKIKNGAQHPQWTAGLADLVRLTILDQHGGVWLDISTILFDGLSWLENLDKIPYLLTNSNVQKGQKPDAIIPYLSFYQSKSQHRDKNGKITNFLPGYQGWFIAARKKSPAITAWRRRFQHLYQSPSDINFRQQVKNDFWTKFMRGDYLNIDKAIHSVIQKKQFQLDQDLTLFGQRINANEHYKVIGIHGQYGPFSIYTNTIPNKDFVMTHTPQQIAQKYYVTVNFFLKFTNVDRPHYQKKINKLIQLSKKHGNISQNFENYLAGNPSLAQCKQNAFIVQGSIFDLLIKDNPKATQNNLYSITREQRDKWLVYCEQKRQKGENKHQQNDSNGQSQFRILGIRFMNYLADIGYITSLQLEMIDKYYINGNKMGRLADVQTTYYWKRLYQQKFRNQSSSGDNRNSQATLNYSSPLLKSFLNPNPQPFSELNSIQRYFLHLKLKIISHRHYIKIFGDLFQEYTLNIYQAAKILFYSLVAINLAMFVIKFNLKLLKPIWATIKYVFNVINEGEIKMQLITQQVSKAKNKVLRLKTRTVVQFGINTFRAILKLIGMSLLSILFMSFNAFIIMKYIDICIDGQSQYQQLTLIGIILLQMLIRRISYDWLNIHSWFMPGIRFYQAYRIFLPVFYFYVGSCIVQMAQKRQQKNFGCAFPLCFVLPQLFKQIQIQAKRIYTARKMQNNFKRTQFNATLTEQFKQWEIKLYQLEPIAILLAENNKYAKFINILVYLFAHVTHLLEIMVLLFLGLCLLLPNLRYLVFNGKYFMKTLVEIATVFGRFFFGVLFCLYIVNVKNKLLQIIRQCKNNKIISPENQEVINSTNDFQTANYSQVSQKTLQIDQQLQNKTLNISSANLPTEKLTLTRKTQSNLNQSIIFSISCVLSVFNHASIIIILLAKYAVNMYTFYILLFEPFSSMILRNSENLWKPKLTNVFLCLFINFQLQAVIEEFIHGFNKRHKQQKDKTNKNLDKSYKKLNQIPSQFSNPQNNYFENYSFVIVSICFITFQLARLNLIQNVFPYLKNIDQGILNKKWDSEKQFPKFQQNMMMWTLIGYSLIKVLTNYLIHGYDGKHWRDLYFYINRKSNKQANFKRAMKKGKQMKQTKSQQPSNQNSPNQMNKENMQSPTNNDILQQIQLSDRRFSQ